MSKAEEKALEAYPVLFSERNGYDNTFKDRRESYIKGYQQAEKDLELTLEDIETILNVENVLLHEFNSQSKLIIETYPTGRDYYQEILKRFNKERKEKCQ